MSYYIAVGGKPICDFGFRFHEYQCGQESFAKARQAASEIRKKLESRAYVCCGPCPLSGPVIKR
jgi:hypothetical protein